MFVCFGGMHIYVLYTIKRATRRQKRNDEAASPFEPDHNEVAITPPKKKDRHQRASHHLKPSANSAPSDVCPPTKAQPASSSAFPAPASSWASTASSTCVLFGGLVNGGEIGVVFQMRVT